MFAALFQLLAALVGQPGPPTCTNQEWAQCGGDGFTGPTCCQDYDNCSYINPYFSQCQPKHLCLVPMWGQCNGTDPKTHTPWPVNKTCCPNGFECLEQNPYYSQVQLSPAASLTLTTSTICSSMPHCRRPSPIVLVRSRPTPPPPQCMPDNKTDGCAPPNTQCGGTDSDGKPWGTKPEEKTCCSPGYQCDVVTPTYYSICNPIPHCTNARFGQCGGVDTDGHPWNKTFGHDTCCPDPFKCVKKDDYYSQCINTTTVAELL